jgi:hypothetical protein
MAFTNTLFVSMQMKKGWWIGSSRLSLPRHTTAILTTLAAWLSRPIWLFVALILQVLIAYLKAALAEGLG